jgi:hypothetical protein
MDRAVAVELARLDRRLEPVLEPEMRRALVLEWLMDCTGDAFCDVASAVLARTRAADLLRRALCDVLTSVPCSRLDYDRRKDLYAEAARLGKAEIMRLLRTVPAKEAVGNPQRLLSKELSELPLGRRRALAKGSHPHWLEQLAKDCDPVVIANLLVNPRTVEPDVVRIAASRPVAAEALVEISKCARWFSRVPVRKALARNPYCPVEIATGIVTSLPLEDLRDMRGDPDLHPETAAQLQQELKRRTGSPRS